MQKRVAGFVAIRTELVRVLSLLMIFAINRVLIRKHRYISEEYVELISIYYEFAQRRYQAVLNSHNFLTSTTYDICLTP